MHVFVDPEGEKIEAMGEVKWKNTIEPIANMQCNEQIQKCLDEVPATFHFNDGSKERHFIKYDKEKVEEPNYFSNFLGSVNSYQGQIKNYDDQVIHERWTEGKNIKNFFKGNDNQEQRPFKYKNLFDTKKMKKFLKKNHYEKRDYEKSK